jgi:hypothetical protein
MRVFFTVGRFFSHSTGPWARGDLWDDGEVLPFQQSYNPLPHTGRGRVQGVAERARANMVPLPARSLSAA